MRRLFLLLFIGPALSAQEYIDLFNVSYSITPETRYDAGMGNTRIQQAEANLLLPIPINPHIAVITGFMGNLNRLEPDPDDPALSVYSAGALLGFNLEHGGGWSSLHVAIPRVASAVEFGRTQFQFGTLQLLQHNSSPLKHISFGAYLNAEEFGLLVVPLFGFYYRKPDDSWEVSALLPSRAEWNFRVSDRYRAGLAFEGLGSSYPIRTENYGEAYVQRAANDLSAFLQYRPVPSLLFTLKSGYSFFRSYRIYDADDRVDISFANVYFKDPRAVLNRSVSDGFFLNFKFIYRYHLSANQIVDPED